MLPPFNALALLTLSRRKLIGAGRNCRCPSVQRGLIRPHNFHPDKEGDN